MHLHLPERTARAVVSEPHIDAPRHRHVRPARAIRAPQECHPGPKILYRTYFAQGFTAVNIYWAPRTAPGGANREGVARRRPDVVLPPHGLPGAADEGGGAAAPAAEPAAWQPAENHPTHVRQRESILATAWGAPQQQQHAVYQNLG